MCQINNPRSPEGMTALARGFQPRDRITQCNAPRRAARNRCRARCRFVRPSGARTRVGWLSGLKPRAKNVYPIRGITQQFLKNEIRVLIPQTVSNDWKTGPESFQSLETFIDPFPIIGNTLRQARRMVRPRRRVVPFLFLHRDRVHAGSAELQ